MTDFELQRRLRDMNAPHVPQDDLWPLIAARIATETVVPQAVRRRIRTWPLAAAAAVLVAIGGVLNLSQPAPESEPHLAQETAATMSRGTILSPRDAEAFARANGTDPRLAGATVVLDSARGELEQAIEERPDAAFLVGLLARTNARRVKLEHYGAIAG